MRAMVMEAVGQPLVERDLAAPCLRTGEVLLAVKACGVCRTDLHVLDGDLPNVTTPRILGHEIVGEITACGPGVLGFEPASLVGIPWLGGTCGTCPYCSGGHENLCDRPEFTGYTRDGGYATHVVARSEVAIRLRDSADPVSTAPLLCAGLIGWRSLAMAGDGRSLGLYGFGAAAHIVAQVALWQGRDVYAFTRPDDNNSQTFARELGVLWAGASSDMPPEPLDAAIIFAPVGSLVPQALHSVRKGGRVVCAGIHMSDIPSFPYSTLWGERQLLSVANLTRKDASEFFAVADRARVRTHVVRYPLSEANQALDDLRHGRFQGAAVLVP